MFICFNNLYQLIGRRKYVKSYLHMGEIIIGVRTLFLLRCCAEEQLDLVEKMQKSLKINTKTNSSLLKEIAVMEANNRKTISPKVDNFFGAS